MPFLFYRFLVWEKCGKIKNKREPDFGNPLVSRLLAGVEGFEPSTNGFEKGLSIVFYNFRELLIIPALHVITVYTKLPSSKTNVGIMWE